MDKKYIDVLLVDYGKSSKAIVIAPSNEARVGDLVELNDGKVGKVLSAAWGGEKDGEMHNLLKQFGNVFSANTVYSRMWSKEGAGHAAEPCDS